MRCSLSQTRRTGYAGEARVPPLLEDVLALRQHPPPDGVGSNGLLTRDVTTTGAGYKEAVAEFAVAYADQNERDHAALAAAVESGRLPGRHDL